MKNCIYCLRAEGVSYTKKEHVIPESFGKFRDNFTLIDTVCDECNQLFGDSIELYLARDSFEGRQRFVRGLKPAREYRSLGRKSELEVTIQEGPFKNARVVLEYQAETDSVVIDPLPQVGFFHGQRNEFQFFLVDEIPTKADLEKNGFVVTKSPKSIMTIALSDEQANRILEERGIRTGGSQDLPVVAGADDKVLILAEGKLLTNILRALSKITFNYMAKVCGRDFVLHEDFNPMRRYIRYGELPPRKFFRITSEPIVADERRAASRRYGHLLALDWSRDKRSLLGHLSLFNEMQYVIELCPNYHGVYREIRKGHVFDIASRKIYELVAYDAGLA